MDWNLFWSAFGAIGSTLGSLITACAVIVAVKQYKQPLKKIVKVEFRSLMEGEYLLSIKNTGVRKLQIIHLSVMTFNGKWRRIWFFLDNIQSESNDKFFFPLKIEPEEHVKIYFEKDIFREKIKDAVYQGLNKKNKLIFLLEDSLGGTHIYKTNIHIGSLIRGI